MFEESPETFVARWRPFATPVHVFARPEGSPLLEVRLGERDGTVLQVLERTGPYLAPPGAHRMIVNPTVERVFAASDPAAPGSPGDGAAAPAQQQPAERAIETTGISVASVRGIVLERDRGMLVVDAGVPLVVGSLAALPDDVAAGDRVRFETLAPIHGFVLPRSAQRGRAESTDDMV